MCLNRRLLKIICFLSQAPETRRWFTEQIHILIHRRTHRVFPLSKKRFRSQNSFIWCVITRVKHKTGPTVILHVLRVRIKPTFSNRREHLPSSWNNKYIFAFERRAVYGLWCRTEIAEPCRNYSKRKHPEKTFFEFNCEMFISFSVKWGK